MTTFLKLRQAMLAHDFQQRDLAEIAGISRGAFSARMHRRADFTAGEMVKIGQALGLQPTEYYDFFLADSSATQAGGRI